MEPWEKLTIAFGAGVLTLAGVFLLVILRTLVGALAGWTVGLLFAETILGILEQFGVRDIQMWQFGAFLGFVGGFLATKVSAEIKKP